jgi:hypothetical protein
MGADHVKQFEPFPAPPHYEGISQSDAGFQETALEGMLEQPSYSDTKQEETPVYYNKESCLKRRAGSFIIDKDGEEEEEDAKSRRLEDCREFIKPGLRVPRFIERR